MLSRKLNLLLITTLFLTACSTNRVPTVFAGYFAEGDEGGAFVLCPLYGEPKLWEGGGYDYLIEATSESRFFEIYSSIGRGVHSAVGRGVVFVRVEGELYPEGAGDGNGHYGHMGRYPHAIIVTKTLEMHPYIEGQCSADDYAYFILPLLPLAVWLIFKYVRSDAFKKHASKFLKITPQ
jgi:hypothetical protein